MYLTTHAAVGVLVAQQTSNPWFAFFGSFVSHFILDFVPHGDEDIGPPNFSQETLRPWMGQRKWQLVLLGVLDIGGIIALVAGLGTAVSLPTLQLLLLGVIGAVLPDFFVNVFPAIYNLAPRNFFIRAVNWGQRKILLDPIVRRINRFHRWVHNPFHDLLPVKMSKKIGVLAQFLILIIFVLAEVSVLGK